MRGLKPSGCYRTLYVDTSHLLQMRGLKQETVIRLQNEIVASFTDAWIETEVYWTGLAQPVVASFTDAWIETKRSKRYTSIYMSHLLQMRGLKLYEKLKKAGVLPSHLLQMRGLKLLPVTSFFVFLVASFTDAWIETT